ncbi:Rib/alpha-like domain-containing protein, partial [Streptococcus sp. ZJ100]
NTIPTEEGHHDVPVVITYKDGSSEEVNVPVDIKKPVDGTTDTNQNPDDTVEIPTEKTLVRDETNLTADERDKIKGKVEEVNPGKIVTVDEQGNATVTNPATGNSTVISGEKLAAKGRYEVGLSAAHAKPILNLGSNAGINIPTAKIPVKDETSLTADEQDQVKAKVEEVNPGKIVTVNAQGNATVTDRVTGDGTVILGEKLVVKGRYEVGLSASHTKPILNLGSNAGTNFDKNTEQKLESKGADAEANGVNKVQVTVTPATSTETPLLEKSNSAKQLPNTGDTVDNAAFVYGVTALGFAALLGLGKKKSEDKE